MHSYGALPCHFFASAFTNQHSTIAFAAGQYPTSAGLLEWMMKADPLDILGLSENCTAEDIKSAFRAKVKNYHPDVYKGSENAEAITQCLINAYELLMENSKKGVIPRLGKRFQSLFPHLLYRLELKTTHVLKEHSFIVLLRESGLCRKKFDPFEEPETEAEDIFVHELLCIGKGCPYSCVARAPLVFEFSEDTGSARAIMQGQGDVYHVQLAVGQCPRNCIYYVTPAQRQILEDLLQRAIESRESSSEMLMLESLIARANFENGRFRGVKRKPKRSTKTVDWY